jgi:hypothetical protein
VPPACISSRKVLRSYIRIRPISIQNSSRRQSGAFHLQSSSMRFICVRSFLRRGWASAASGEASMYKRTRVPEEQTAIRQWMAGRHNCIHEWPMVRFADNPLGIIRLDWRMAVMRQLDSCPHGVGTSKPLDGEDDLAEWAAIDKAYPRSLHSRFPSTRAMPTDDLLYQFFAEPSGKRARAQ